MSDKTKIAKLTEAQNTLEADLRDLTIKYNSLGKSPAYYLELEKMIGEKGQELQQLKDQITQERLS